MMMIYDPSVVGVVVLSTQRSWSVMLCRRFSEDFFLDFKCQ